MTALSALPRALVNAGLAKEPKERKNKGKQFKCHRCKHNMTKVPDSNVMYCSNCGQYFLFNKVM